VHLVGFYYKNKTGNRMRERETAGDQRKSKSDERDQTYGADNGKWNSWQTEIDKKKWNDLWKAK
jgi:hypothetical protein